MPCAFSGLTHQRRNKLLQSALGDTNLSFDQFSPARAHSTQNGKHAYLLSAHQRVGEVGGIKVNFGALIGCGKDIRLAWVVLAFLRLGSGNRSGLRYADLQAS